MNNTLTAQNLDLAQKQYGAGQINQLQAYAERNAGDDKAIKQVAKDFESVFIGQMLQPIFDTIPQDSLFGGGPGEKIFRSMMVDEMGKEIAQAGGIGIAQHVMDQLIKMQEN